MTHSCCQDCSPSFVREKWEVLGVFSSQEAGKGCVWEDGYPCSCCLQPRGCSVAEELAQAFWSVLEAGTGRLLYLAFRWSKILLQMGIAEVRAAMEGTEEEEEGFQGAVSCIARSLDGFGGILSHEHSAEVVPPAAVTHCLLPSLAPLQSVSLQFLLQHIFICSVPFWLFDLYSCSLSNRG